jgi:hypothetical protein
MVERWKTAYVSQHCLARFDEVIVSVRVRQRRPYWRATCCKRQPGHEDCYSREGKGEQK